jgi:cell division protein FtsB
MSSKAKRYLAILGVLLVLATFVGYQFVSQWTILQALNAEKATKQQLLDTKTSQNEALQKDLDDSSTDSFVERMAREILGWVKPGEIKIVDKNK